MDAFFHPHGIAVIGASADPGKLGYAVARNVIQSGFSGAVRFINPKGGELFGQPLYPTLADAPDPLDLAIVIVPAPAAPQALREVGQRGIRAAILTSGGFRETGPAGAALEAQVHQVCAEFDMRLLGPNCIGLLDTHLPLDTTFLPPPLPQRGGIAFLSHSGAFCAAIIDWSRDQGFGFSRLVSLGNQADLTETDFLPTLAADAHTRVITLYLEGIGNGRHFVEEARRVSQIKPIIALKVGRSEAGQKAAASHTGALAAGDVAFDAAFAKAGILRANTAEEMFDWARALETCPLPSGKRIAVLTNAGGPGVIAADALEAHGLQLAALSEATVQALARLLPPAASPRNPVDMLASATPEHYADCLRLLLDDPNVDAALVIIPPSPVGPTEDIAHALCPLIAASPKPVTVTLMGATLVHAAAQVFHAAQVPIYPFPERAASALGALHRRVQKLGQKPREKSQKISPSPVPAGASPDELVAAYGIPTAPIFLAQSPEQAATLAAEMGFPVVLKIDSPDIPHKSDVGGVILNLRTPQAVKEAYVLAMRNSQERQPNARITGCTLQRQAPPGQEVILGMVRDPQFGPLMMFGSGGVEVEGLKDVAFALAPLTLAEARDMIEKTWAGRKLDGFRSIAPGDKAAVIDVLVRLSHLALEHEDILEIEINPLRVLSSGVVAIDVRLQR